MKIILTTFLLLSSVLIFAGKPQNIEIEIDSNQFGISNQFSFKLIMIDKKGNRSKLIPGDSDYRWEKVEVVCNHLVTFENGRIVFNQRGINASNHLTEFKVTYAKELTVSENIAFPYVAQLNVLNNALLINQAEPLLLELVFQNNHKTNYASNLFDLSQLECVKPFKLLGEKIIYEQTELLESNLVELEIYSKQNSYLKSMKSMGVNYPVALSLFYGGQNGEDARAYQPVFSAIGYSGGDGNKGKDLTVFVEELQQKDDLFIRLIIFQKDGTKDVQILQWSESPIQLIVDGGKGGNGGNGGNSQRYDLHNKRVEENKPGYGGNGGNGGDAGQIIIYSLLSEEKLNAYVKLSTQGGKGGVKGNSGTQFVNNNRVVDPRRSGTEGEFGSDSSPVFTILSDQEKFEYELSKMGQAEL
jgi:hypothetical protein